MSIESSLVLCVACYCYVLLFFADNIMNQNIIHVYHVSIVCCVLCMVWRYTLNLRNSSPTATRAITWISLMFLWILYIHNTYTHTTHMIIIITIITITPILYGICYCLRLVGMHSLSVCLSVSSPIWGWDHVCIPISPLSSSICAVNLLPVFFVRLLLLVSCNVIFARLRLYS